MNFIETITETNVWVSAKSPKSEAGIDVLQVIILEQDCKLPCLEWAGGVLFDQPSLSLLFANISAVYLLGPTYERPNHSSSGNFNRPVC